MEHVYLTYKVKKVSTVKDILLNNLKVSSRLLRKLKLNHRIFCNEREVWINDVVNVGDELLIDITFRECNDKIKAQYTKLDILYEDNSILAINKPANMVVHPTCIHQENTLANFVKGYLGTKGEELTTRFINRLDRETSGVIIFAKNEYTQNSLSNQMQVNKFEKEYIAVVHGILEKERDTISLPIKREENSIMTRTIADDGEKAITHYQVIKRLDDMTVVKIKLETGRTHQIRVHMKAIGHPLVGDGLYSDIRTDKIDRQALHAKKVSFIHPINGRLMHIEASLPEDIKKLIF